MSEFLAHDANFVRQISQQMVHVMQPSVRVNNLDSNLVAITVQFSFVYTRFLLSECHEWSAVPISVCLLLGPRGCFRSVCCTGGEPIATQRVNHSLAPTHQPRERGWTALSTVYQVFDLSQTRSEPSLYQLWWRMLKQLHRLAGS